jgi:hypothetical protein
MSKQGGQSRPSRRATLLIAPLVVDSLRLGHPTISCTPAVAWQRCRTRARESAADPGINLPSSQTDHDPRGPSVSSAAPTGKLTQFSRSASIGNLMMSR